MRKIIFITLLLSTILVLTACQSTPKPSVPEKPTSEGSIGEMDMEDFLPVVQNTIKEYEDGEIGVVQKENTEPSFMPLPENTKLPVVTSKDDLTYGGFVTGIGGYLVTVPCPDSEYKMNFIIINLVMDDGEDYQTSAVYFE